MDSDRGNCISPTLVSNFSAHSSAVCSASLDESATQLASGGSDGTLKIWKIRPKMRAYILENPEPSPLHSVSFAPCGSFVATASGSSVRLWTPQLKSECRTIRCHLSTVRSVDVSPDSTNLLTGSDDKTVKVWNIQPQRFLFGLKGHKNWVRCVRFMGCDTAMLGSCGDDKSVKLWDFRSRTCIYTFLGHKDSVRSVDFDWTEKLIVSAGLDDCLNVWDIRAQRLLQNHSVNGIEKIACSKDVGLVAGACKDGTVKLIDLVEGRLAFTLHGHQSGVQDVSFASSMLASADTEGKVPSSDTILIDESDEWRASSSDKDGFCTKRPTHTSPARDKLLVQADTNPVNNGIANEKPINKEDVSSLLNGIMDQLENLTQVVSRFDARLSAVESKLGLIERP